MVDIDRLDLTPDSTLAGLPSYESPLRQPVLAQRCLAEAQDETIENSCRGGEKEKRCGDKKTGLSALLAARRAAPIVLLSGRPGPQSFPSGRRAAMGGSMTKARRVTAQAAFVASHIIQSR
jgi:hypothetical protein